MNTGIVIEGAHLSEMGDLEVLISGHRFWAGEKYTILELGWAVYRAEDELPEDWVRKYGETRAGDQDWSEFNSTSSLLMTSHPVLVALALRAWWQRNRRPIATAPIVEVPTFEAAVEMVRTREIINDCNQCHAGIVPGLMRWGPNVLS